MYAIEKIVWFASYHTWLKYPDESFDKQCEVAEMIVDELYTKHLKLFLNDYINNKE